MIFFDEKDSRVKGRFVFDYKGYDVICYTNGKVYITLEDEDLGDGESAIDVKNAIEWIEEDIKCREKN